MRIYLDVGCLEKNSFPREIREYFVTDFVVGLRSFYSFLNTRFPATELKLVIDKDGDHTVADAARRFSQAFLWLFER